MRNAIGGTVRLQYAEGSSSSGARGLGTKVLHRGMLEGFTPDTGYPSRSRDFTIPAALCEKNDENEEYD